MLLAFVAGFAALFSGEIFADCLQNFRALARARDAIVDAKDRAIQFLQPDFMLFHENAKDELDALSFAIFGRVRLDPNALLTAEELAHIKAKGAEEALKNYRAASQTVRDINFRMALQNRSRPGSIEHHGVDKWLDRARRWVLPYLPESGGSGVREIYERFLRNPESATRLFGLADLTAAERELLKKAGLEGDFLRFLGDLNNFREPFVSLTNARSRGGKIYWGALATAGVGAAALSQFGHEEISVQESFDESRPEGMHGLEHECELIISESPQYPVLIRIRGRLYAFTSAGYVATQISGPQLDSFQNLTLKNLRTDKNFTRYPFLRVRLNLTPEQQEHLRSEVLGKKWLGKVRLNDGILRNPLYRASQVLEEAAGFGLPPGTTLSTQYAMAYLKAQKLLGSSKIGDIYYVSEKPPTLADRALDVSGDLFNSLLYSSFAVGLGAGSLASEYLWDPSFNISR